MIDFATDPITRNVSRDAGWGCGMGLLFNTQIIGTDISGGDPLHSHSPLSSGDGALGSMPMAMIDRRRATGQRRTATAP
jgi:hypothetical protein